MSKRLDLWLAENGMAKSRERAKELVKNGSVSVDGKIITKPSATVDENSIVTVAKSEQEYVGRGALKLKTAFEKFSLNVEGKCCGDIGASTGGFTQIMLENGARKVYAIDVGHGQLAKELVEKFKALVESNGTLESVDEWGKRRLAYLINDEAEGYYVLFNYEAEAGFPAELERVAKITDGVLRTLIVKK